MDDIGIWILVSLGIIVGALAALYGVGYFLPRSHQVERTLALKQTPNDVWPVITDFANAPTWQKHVVKVERMPDQHGHEVWKETYPDNYGLILETTEAIAPTRLVRTITDEKGPFTGRWEFSLAATPTGCTLTITEFGAIGNPFFRLMFRLFMKPETYLVMYLSALAKRFGAPADLA